MARPPSQIHALQSRDMVEEPKGSEAFPDLSEIDLDDKDPLRFVEVIEDDIAEADRGKPTSLEGLEQQEEDLRDVSERAKKRINRLKFEQETERRGREQAERERDQLVIDTRNIMAENEQLRRETHAGTTALAASMTAAREAALVVAKKKLRDAHEAGDSDAMADAQMDLARLTSEITEIKARTPRAEAAPEQRQQPAPQQPQPTAPVQSIAPNVLNWIAHNREWFQRPGSEDRTQLAYALHNTLLKRGVAPTSDEYTRELDRGLKAVYSDHRPFSASAGEDNTDEGRSAPRRTNVVADGSRENGLGQPASRTPRTVRLTRSQLAIARRLNVTPQAYALEVLKLAAKGDGA